jgi:hypothetical protein
MLSQMSENQILSLLNQFSSGAIWAGEILNILPSVLLTISMYGLCKIFNKKAAKLEQ